MLYFVKTPWLLKKLYKDCTWEMPATTEKLLYLSFDDGPHPEITPFVLDELKKYNAKATFFCIGKNVVAYPETYRRIVEEGHGVGNHTNNHLNGWRTDDDTYMDNIKEASNYIDSDLFRPPYGRITKFQLRLLKGPGWGLKTIMWSILSGDFDKKCSLEQCLRNVIGNAKNGSIIVMHDSEKAFTRLRYALPEILKILSDKGFQFEKIKA
jgi:peptidoglycan/xylan/chitin deacetylase (PgdA/CDA1 family)